MINKVILLGRLGSDPETRFLPSGDPLATFSVATSRSWKDKSGDKVEKTEWHRVTIFGKLAEIAGKYLKKGSLVYLEGRIETQKWQKDGVDQYSTGIVAETMKMLDGKPSEPGQAGSHQSNSGNGRQPALQADNFDDYNDNIPF